MTLFRCADPTARAIGLAESASSMFVTAIDKLDESTAILNREANGCREKAVTLRADAASPDDVAETLAGEVARNASLRRKLVGLTR